MDPKRAKLNQKSVFGHVQSYSWLNKLRNSQGKIYGTYSGKIYGIYKEYIRNIHKYLWYKIIRNTGTAFGGAPLGLCFCLFYTIDIYGYSSYIPYIFHIYFLNMFHIFSLVCFLIYSMNSRSGHYQITTFGPILHTWQCNVKFRRGM